MQERIMLLIISAQVEVSRGRLSVKKLKRGGERNC